MRVVVDGIVYGFNKFGGINAYFNEILPRLAQQFNVEVELLVPNTCAGELPRGPLRFRRREFGPRLTGLSWKLDNVVLPKIFGAMNTTLRTAQLKFGKKCVFQSTYFTWTNDGTPQVATAYDMNHELFPELYQSDWGKWLRRQYRTYIERATRVLAISAKTKRDIVEIYGIDAGIIDVVHLAASYDVFRPNDAVVNGRDPVGDRSKERPYMFFVGGRDSYKNFPLVLKALCRLPEIDLIAAGGAWSEAERAMIQSLGLQERVRLVVHPDGAALRQLYCGCYAFVFPSLHEGFGVPLLEAMACGAPVLASDTEIFREVAGAAALYFDPREPESLCSAVEALRTAAVRDQQIALGRQQAAKYSWDRCAEETLAVYEKAGAA